MRTKARAFRRPTTAPSPPVVVVFFLGCFVFGLAPHRGPWSLRILSHGVQCPFLHREALRLRRLFHVANFGMSDASFSWHGRARPDLSTAASYICWHKRLSVTWKNILLREFIRTFLITFLSEILRDYFENFLFHTLPLIQR